MLKDMKHGNKIKFLLSFEFGKRRNGDRNLLFGLVVIGIEYVRFNAFSIEVSTFEEVNKFPVV